MTGRIFLYRLQFQLLCQFVVILWLWAAADVSIYYAVVVTALKPAQYQHAMRLYRSLWANSMGTRKCAGDQDGCVSLLIARVCLYPNSNEIISNEQYLELQAEFRGIDVSLELLDISLNFEFTNGNNSGSDIASIACAAQIAQRYTDQNAKILYIDSSYIAIADIHQYFESDIAVKPDSFYCHPPNPSEIGPSFVPFCDLRLFAFNSYSSYDLSSAAHVSSLAQNISQVLLASAMLCELFNEFQFFPQMRVVYAGRDWDMLIDSSTVAFVEFDGVEQQLDIRDCYLHVFVKWENFNTIPIISKLLANTGMDERIMAGCADELILRRNSEQRERFAEQLSVSASATAVAQQSSRVFDIILFNDEIELLQLRLKAMEESIDVHVIVEGNQTFTGRAKSLHFLENRAIFEAYRNKIVHVIVDRLPFNDITHKHQIWANEYFSRDCAHRGLLSAGARDEDIVLVADVDEIPYPSSIKQLRLLLHPNRKATHRVYKLYPENFLYNFSCFAGIGGLLRGGALTASTWAMAKRLTSGSGSEDRYLANLRHYLQKSNAYYPLRNVLFPGSVHLSFFGGLQRIASKLRSYSHQNFASSYYVANVSDTSNIEISPELVTSTIESGVNINRNAETATCKQKIFSEFEKSLKDLWDKAIAFNIDVDRNRNSVNELGTVETVMTAANGVTSWVPGEVDVTSNSLSQDLNEEPTDPLNLAVVGVNKFNIPDHDNMQIKVAFVTGCIVSATDHVYIPVPIADPAVDNFFIVNDPEVGKDALAAGYYVVVLAHIPILNASLETAIANSMHSKLLKVFPQKLVEQSTGKKYDFVIWMDNKYDIGWEKVWQTIRSWPASIAIMMPRPQVCCGAKLFFETSMGQQRYAVGRPQLEAYIAEQLGLGFVWEDSNEETDQSYASGFIIYNTNHPNTTLIQDMWYEHIKRAGIQCQISLYFVAQRFKSSLQVYPHVWFLKGRIVFHQSYEDAVKFINST